MRNNYFVEGETAKIELNRKNGKEYCVVSLESLQKLKDIDVKWCLLDQNKHTCYVVANLYIKGEGKRTIRMHRVITDAEERMVVNHINGDGLDNQLSNLEVVTTQLNTIKRVNNNNNNTSGFRGISFCKRESKWEVKFRKNYKTHHFGRYKELVDAVQVAKKEFEKLFGEKYEIGVPTT